MTEAKRASIRDQLARVYADINEQREDTDEWRRLEQENLDLRLELQAHIHTKQHYQQSNMLSSPSALDGGGGGGASNSSFRTLGEQELLLLRTTSFLSSSSAILRTQLQELWREHRNIGVAIGLEHKLDAAAAAAGAAAATATPATLAPVPAPSTRDEQCELSWILQTLPRCSPPPAVATPLPIISDSPRMLMPKPGHTQPAGGGGHAQGQSAARPAAPPLPPPVPRVSHQSAYGTLEYPLERISTEWRAVFPPELLALSDGSAEASERDRAEFEALLEDVWDSIQANRSLYEEFATPASKAAAAASSQTGAGGGLGGGGGAGVSSGSFVSNGETVMTHAMENYGFFTNRRLRAAMMGRDPNANATTAANAAAATNAPTAASTTATALYTGPYEFDEADSPSNIVMDEAAPGVGGGSGSDGSANPSSRTIKCATLNKLIERVTHEKYVDLNTRYVFLLTYHSFTTPRELLSKLSSRFHVPLPPNLTPEELHHFRTHKQERIQIRVCSVLKNWLDEHWMDFADDETLKRDLQRLIQSMLDNAGSVLTTQLAKALNALLRKKERGTLTAGGGSRSVAPSVALSSGAFPCAATASASVSGSGSGSGTVAPPKLLISSRLTLESFELVSVDETELARQLTLIDFEKFRSIQPRECLNQNWSKPLAVKSVLAPNILAMISQFNKVSLWVEATIVRQKELKMRIKYYEKFIKIADQCRSLNNFNSLFAIYCGLSSNPIHRLRRTKAGVASKYQAKFAEFADLFRGDKNSRNFRRVLQQSLTPAIPHLGIFLSDLTFIEDGNPDLLLDSMINFQKRAKLAERIRFIKQYQQEGYNLQPAPVIQAYFRRELTEDVDAEALWKMSKEVEPREAAN